MSNNTSIRGWYRPSRSTEQLIVKSSLVTINWHWVPEIAQHVRCAEAGCVLCESGQRAKWHESCVVIAPGGKVCLLELTEENLAVRAQLRALGPDAVGALLLVSAAKDESGSASVDLLDERLDQKPIPCARYMAALGRRGYDRVLQMKLFT